MADTKTTRTKKGSTTGGERATGARRRREATPTEADDEATGSEAHAGHGDGVCPVAFCPIGAALSAAQQVRPDTVEHLLLAGRELMLAAKAVLDARLEDMPESNSTLERVEIG